MSSTFPRRWLVWLLLAAIVGSLLPLGHRGQALAQVDGNTYVSPTFKYRLTWDETWFVVKQSSEDGVDRLTLTNGTAFVYVYGSRGFNGNALPCAYGYGDFLAKQPGITNVKTMKDENGADIEGGDVTQAWSAYSYTYATSDGGSVNLTDHIECRTIVPDESVLQITAQMRTSDYVWQMPAAENLKASLQLASPGEAGPVFVSGEWRVAVVAAVRAPSVPEVGLKATDGKDWVVLVLDVTNWGKSDATFDPSVAVLNIAGKQTEIAERSTLGVAKRLSMGPANLDSGIAIPVGESTRVILVYRVLSGARNAALTIGDESLPLLSALAHFGVNLRKLPELVAPPELIAATVDRTRDGGRLELTMPDGSFRSVVLSGTDPPTGKECYAKEARRGLKKIAKGTVWLEDEELGSTSASFYVWRENADGTRSLLNQQFVVAGYSGQRGGNVGRFGSWITAAEGIARDNEIGLWGACTDVHGTSKPASSVSPETDSAATPAASPIAGSSTAVDTSLDGNWVGATAEGEEIEFTVKNHAITELSVSYTCSGTNGGDSWGSSKLTPTSPFPMEGNEFTIAFEPMGFSISGRFTSNESAEGTLEMSVTSCQGGFIATTWRATRS